MEAQPLTPRSTLGRKRTKAITRAFRITNSFIISLTLYLAALLVCGGARYYDIIMAVRLTKSFPGPRNSGLGPPGGGLDGLLHRRTKTVNRVTAPDKKTARVIALASPREMPHLPARRSIETPRVDKQ